MEISQSRPTILNKMRMRIILNKQDCVGMEATYPKSTPLPSVSRHPHARFYEVHVPFGTKIEQSMFNLDEEN